jgi:predicted transcriptional regulator
MHMKRVQVQLGDAQVHALQELASASSRPLAAIVRDAVDAWIEADDRRRQGDRALAAIGGFHSGLGDLAERHDQYLDDMIP